MTKTIMAIIGFISLLLVFLRTCAEIVGPIWVLVLMRWGDFAIALGVWCLTFAISSIFLLPISLLSFKRAASLLHEGHIAIGICFALAGSLWTYLIVAGWCLATIVFFADRSHGDLFPYLLCAYGVSWGAWCVPLVENPRKYRDTPIQGDIHAMIVISAFAAEAGCLAMMMGVIFFHSARNLHGVLPFLLPAMIALSLAQIAFSLMVASVWAPRVSRPMS